MTRSRFYEYKHNLYIRANGSRNLAMLLVFFALAVCVSTPTFAGPQGGNVVGGLAQITRPDAVTTNIVQATEKAIINWNGFNIDTNELVKFVQPSANAVTLNRVTGADPSTILGQLVANGRVFLVNPNGVVFGSGSNVDVGSLIATTFDLKNDDFLSGNYDFLQKTGKDASYVINKGQIKVADNGFVFLVAPGVKNKGLIIANIGKVVLGSGNKFTVDFRGDGLITYEISGKVVDKVKGPDGAPLTSAVSNTGKISNRGGEVVLTGDAANEVVSSVINQEGVIEAKSLVSKGGIVKLVGGDEGIVQNRGKIDVSADESSAKLGEVSISGNYVGNFGTIFAKGAEEARGGNITLNSTTQTLGSSFSLIDVSGGIKSSGGNIQLLSDRNTTANGTLRARGGELGGDGGFIELSSLGGLSFTGQIDTLAPFGRTGTLLIDPKNVWLDVRGHTPLTDIDQFADTPREYAYVDAASISAAAANVMIQANNDIAVHVPIDITAAGVGLTLQAGRVVSVDESITTNNGAVSITANDQRANAINRDAGPGEIWMDYDATINAGSAPITLTVDGTGGMPGSIGVNSLVGNNVTVSSVEDLYLYGMINVQNQASIESKSGFIYSDGGSINAKNLLVKAATGVGYSFSDLPLITTVDNLAADCGTGDAAIHNTKAVTITTIGSTAGVSAAGNIDLKAPTFKLKSDVTDTGAGEISLDGNVVLTGDVGVITTSGNITINGTINGDATPNSLDLISTTGNVNIAGAIGAVSPLSNLTIAGESVSIKNIGGAIAGVTGATLVTSSTYGGIELAGTTYNAHRQTYNSDDAYGILFNGGGTTTFTSSNKAITFKGPIDLNTRDFIVNAGGGAVTFNGIVSGDGNLVVNSAGDTTFNDSVGLSSITTDVDGRTIINGESVSTIGAQTYGDDVILGAAMTQIGSEADGDITFNGKLDGASDTAVYTSGLMTFNSAVGSTTPLTSLSISYLGTVAINGGSVTTTGDQVYNGSVILGAPVTTLTSTEDHHIVFVDSLNGASDLIVNTADTAEFCGSVGDVSALASITINGGSTEIKTSEVTTTGTQTYGEGSGKIYLYGPSSKFISTEDADITFNDEINGYGDLTVNTAGTTTFGGSVEELTSITTNGGGWINFDASEVTTAGAQTYSGPVSIGNDISFNSYYGDITFTSTIDGEYALSVNTNGDVIFGGIIGGITPVTTLDITTGNEVAMLFDATTSVSVNTSSANRDIWLRSLTSDIPLGVINAGTGKVSLTAAKSIIDANGTANNILSPSIALRATTGIGTVENPIESRGITTLAASTATGDICLTNTGALTIGMADGLTGVEITSSESTGTIALTANSPLIINKPVVNAGLGDITLNAGASSEDDDITADAPITANGGDVTIIAADDVDQNEDISTSGTGNVLVTAGTGSVAMDSGASTTVANGNVTYRAQDNISVNEIVTATTGTGGHVTLTMLDGNVIDLNGAAPNITANKVTTSATGEVLDPNNDRFLQGLINTGCLPDMVIINNHILYGTMMDELLRATLPLDFQIFRGVSNEFLEELLITSNTGNKLTE